MSDEMIRFLMSAGLTKSQATSVTAETAVRVLMQEDGKALIKEAQRQVSEMREIVLKLKHEYQQLCHKMEGISQAISDIAKAQETYGEITDEKGRNVVALYATILAMNERLGVDHDEAAQHASYISYAYLGGQAKREITLSGENEK